MRRKTFRVIVFDWGGTAVKNRSADARKVARALQDLLRLDVYVVVVTGTNYDNIERQFARHISGPCKRNLYICTNRGSEVFGFDARSELYLLYHREATDEENAALDRVAEAVKARVESESGIGIEIIYNRLNRRKIDLIPEWSDPPKSQINKLLKETEKRLREGGYSPGIRGVYEAAERYAREMGLAYARITSDVKHVEVGLTDKSDSLRWILREVAERRNIPYHDILVLGDELASSPDSRGPISVWSCPMWKGSRTYRWARSRAAPPRAWSTWGVGRTNSCASYTTRFICTGSFCPRTIPPSS